MQGRIKLIIKFMGLGVVPAMAVVMGGISVGRLSPAVFLARIEVV